MGKQRDALKSLPQGSLLSRLVACSSDLALVLDAEGKIVEVSVGDGLEQGSVWEGLIGKRWTDALAKDSQGKVEQLLGDARQGRPGRARELNLKAAGLGEVPFRFKALALDDRERVIALGRDLRPVASLQQRMVALQQSMDRDYGRLRQVDTRYRLLFHISSEGVVVVDDSNRRILEANPAAATMLGDSTSALQELTLRDLFEAESFVAVEGLMAGVAAGARPADVQARLRGHGQLEVTVSAFLFRQAGAALILIRFWPSKSAPQPVDRRNSRTLAVLDALPDSFVVTGEDRRILSANIAFCELVQQANENQVIGEPLDRWLGRPGVDLEIMLANLREHGTVKNFATIVRSEFGPSEEALVTAVSALDGKVACIGFAIRTVSSRLSPAPVTSTMPRSVDQLRELVGRVPLKDLVREASDLVERLCIEAALEVSGNNRASAAQLLGLSRQALYTKLRRYGIAEFANE